MRKNSKTISLKELASITASTLVGAEEHCISGVEDIESASGCEATFLENPRYCHLLKECKAGVIFIHPKADRIEGKNYLLSQQPSLAFQRAIEYFIEELESGFQGIHPTAVIHPEAILGEGVRVGPHSVIDRKVTIGNNCFIGANVTIAQGASIGENCYLHDHSSVRERCVLRDRIVLQNGAVIGSSGFGYHTDERGRHTPLKQLGIVILEDDVEIGANTTIDRARFKTTRIASGTKIDNLVQIAHQVHIGKDCLIVSQVGIAGSTSIGNNVIIGGQAGIIGHITIGDQIILAARSTPIKSLTEKGVYSGAPAIPIREFNEQMVYVKRLKQLFSRVKKLECNSSSETSAERPSSLEE